MDSLKQIGRFVITGLINTGIDFAVLNLLIALSGVNKGYYIIIFTTLSFLVATTNSFLMNKYWTFGDGNKKARDKTIKDVGQFILITLGGLLINVGITSLVSNYIPPFLGILDGRGVSQETLQSYWVNFAKAGATGVSLIWNFVGYKFWVFKK